MTLTNAEQYAKELLKPAPKNLNVELLRRLE